MLPLLLVAVLVAGCGDDSASDTSTTADTASVSVYFLRDGKVWPNLWRPGTPVSVLWGGDWEPGAADLLRPGDPGYDEAVTTYTRRWPRLHLPAGQLVVRIRYAGPPVGNP